ncbi:MAG TPA: Crp/Fnr family transcriptional regulator [Candidatus Dormibacteraeota bacterium]
MSAPTLAREDVDFLSLLSEVNRRRLLEGSTRAVFPAGSIAFHPEGPPASFLLEHGLARAYSSVPDGRQATVTFFHARDLIGGVTLMGRPPRIHVQAVVDCTMATLDLETVRKLAMTEIEVTIAIGTHMAARIRSSFQLIAVRSLGTIRERLAYDLLDRACRSQLVVGRLDVRATHADLADSIGSSREVVSRALRDLRAASIVETAPGMVRVIDPMHLAAIVRAFVI